jgi:uncharacterized SAM-binding protein YcdF (DUF218 family)
MIYREYKSRRLRRGVSLLLVPFVLCVAGFLIFAATVPDAVEDTMTVTDSVVVLTGGSGRLEVGLSLLHKGYGRKLFVSGVYHSVDVANLLRLARQRPDQVECCVILGHGADNTYGNAAETAAWLKSEHFHSVRLVTANYHMHRSLLEFRRAMPDVLIVPNPVFPEAVKQRRWWRWPGTTQLIATEYVKYVAALLGHPHPQPEPGA